MDGTRTDEQALDAMDLDVERRVYGFEFKNTKTWGLIRPCDHAPCPLFAWHSPRRFTRDIALAFELAAQVRLFECGYVLHRPKDGSFVAPGWYVSRVSKDEQFIGLAGATTPQLAIVVAVIALLDEKDHEAFR